MVTEVPASEVKTWLSDGAELAFFDVRELGQFGEAHPFFAVPLPFSNFEIRLPALAPRTDVRLVLIDDNDGIAHRAARIAEKAGYTSVFTVAGGAAGWLTAGYTLYAGVNVPSKTFGELLETIRRTPHLTPGELANMQREGHDHLVVDGRPFGEFVKFSIPGGICCPNGELSLRIDPLTPDPTTPVIVNCAGRTRSILGAQTLIDVGLPNPVYALENGTQGWMLEGLELDSGANRLHEEAAPPDVVERRRRNVRTMARAAGAQVITRSDAETMLLDRTRTTYVIDVRTHEEYTNDGLPGSLHALGGQLVQATDQWIGVRGAQIVLLDNNDVRASMTAYWLSQLGHAAYVLDGGVLAGRELPIPTDAIDKLKPPPIPPLAPQDLQPDHHQLVDLRASMRFRDCHIAGAQWSIRSRLDRVTLSRGRPVVLAGDANLAAFAAKDLTELNFGPILHLSGDVPEWRAAGLPVCSTPDSPVDTECIDFLFFTSRRHQGDVAASRQYLEWEMALVDQLDDQERAAFRIHVPPGHS
ncbi:MAG: rhodanese-like domain-containing protein [Hyphomicrobiaceae bacterium]